MLPEKENLLTPYNPNSSPEKYPYGRNSLRDAFGRETSKYAHQASREGSQIHYIQLLCPDYPHDGKNFTYEGALGEGLNPTVYSDFLPKTELFLHGVAKLGLEPGNVVLHPLICEIESDISEVTGKFAEGLEAEFERRVACSAGCARDVYSQKFPYATIRSGTFKDLLPNLAIEQAFIGDKMRYLLASKNLPTPFEKQLHYIATNRNYMFTRLYGASSYPEYFDLAFRQMCNYLSVYVELAKTFNNGCVVANKHTPNEFYLKQNKKLLRSLLELNDDTKVLPIFHFF
jgi:hypothetical protein